MFRRCSVFIERLRRLQIPVLRGGCLAEEDPRAGARSSVLRSVLHWYGEVPVAAARSCKGPFQQSCQYHLSGSRTQIIDLTRFQVSEDPDSYTKTFFVFSARKYFFENPSSHYSWKFNGHVEHIKMTAIVRTIRCASAIGLPTPSSLPLGPCKVTKVLN